ncbi:MULTISPECIES: hypothetical protein [Prevotella]|nr:MULTISPECIES: hypothetical protein [Prevotella]
MMRKLFYIVCGILTVAFTSCRKEIDPADIAAQTARQYYDYLIHGNYEAYVEGLDKPDRIPDDYKKQLLLNARMFMEQQQKEHHGIHRVSVANADADTARKVARVFLLLSYGDSTREQVYVPMVMRDGIWYLR